MSTYDEPVRTRRDVDERHAVDDRYAADDRRADDRRVVDDRYATDQRAAAVDERTSVRTSSTINGLLRALGAVAGGVAVVIGIVALIRIDWANGFDSAAVDVAGMTFTPVVAIVTLVLGLLAMAAGAAVTREPKLVMGGILVCLGLAVVIAGSSRDRFDLETNHGWLALIIGAVLVVTGLLMRNWIESRRTVRAAEAQRV